MKIKTQENTSRLVVNLKEVSDDTSALSWVNRIVTSIKRPFIHNKILVHPCVLDGNSTLIYQNRLHKKNPSLYKYLVEFAARNDFQLKEDRRFGKRRIRKDSTGRIMPMMVLGAGMVTRAGFAADAGLDATDSHPVNNGHYWDRTGTHTIDAFSDESLHALMIELLNCIHENSTLSYSGDKTPSLKQVAAEDMAKIAFGGSLRKDLDLKKFKIYGLYNFQENTIYLVDGLDLGSEKGKAILLHELVHFLQYQEGQENDVKCRNKLETLAYLLEKRYLTSHGQLNQEISVNRINRISECGDSKHT